jgi:hypothetical protein
MLLVEALAAQARRDHAHGDLTHSAKLRPVGTPRCEIRPAINAMPSDHRRFAAVHGRDRSGNLLRDDRFAQQGELHVEDDAGRTAGDGRGGAVPAQTACGPNRHRNRAIDKQLLE